MLDDVSFAAEGEGSVNLAPNPSFEDITPMNYASGGIISRNTMKYGYMETRARGAPGAARRMQRDLAAGAHRRLGH